MSRKIFFDNRIMYMPPSGGIPVGAGEWMDQNTPTGKKTYLGRIKHQAFAAGFFGFHYIRATVENAPSFRKDSLHRFLNLLNALQLDDGFTQSLNITKIQTLPEFKNQIIRRISLEIGDYFCTSAQWMVELGFQLAVTHSVLVTASNCRSSSELRNYLKMLQSRISQLILLAEKSEVPDSVVESIVKSAQTIHHHKTQRTARKCLESISLAACSLLVTNVAVGILD